MADIEDLEDALEENIGKAQRLSSDAGMREAQPLADQIAAVRFIAGQRAARNSNSFFGLRIKQCVPGSPAE